MGVVDAASKKLSIRIYLSLAHRKVFLWLLLLSIVSAGLLSLLLSPDLINPLRFKEIVKAEVLSIEAINDDVLSPSRKIVLRLDNGEVQWGLGQGYQVGDNTKVLIYQRLMTRSLEYRLLRSSLSER